MKRLGRHELLREVGTAGLLTTHEATHDDGSAVRLRALVVDLDAPEDALATFRDAATRAASASHVGLVRVVDWDSADPIHVSTEEIRGVSLAEAMARAPSGRLEPTVVAGLGSDVAAALLVAHGAGLVHAALSPEAVFLCADGQVRVTDFAIARLVADQSAALSAVMRAAISYVSPEQLTGGVVQPATDVFGLGVLLYRAATAGEPFEAASPLGTKIRLTMSEPTPIPEGTLPDGFAPLIMQMLKRTPADRPPLAEAVQRLRRIAQADSGWRRSVRAVASGNVGSSSDASPEVSSPAASPTAAAPPSAGPAPMVSAPPSLAPVVSTPPSSSPMVSAPPSLAPVVSAPPSSSPMVSAPPSLAPVVSAPPPIAPVASPPVAASGGFQGPALAADSSANTTPELAAPPAEDWLDGPTNPAHASVPATDDARPTVREGFELSPEELGKIDWLADATAEGGATLNWVPPPSHAVAPPDTGPRGFGPAEPAASNLGPPPRAPHAPVQPTESLPMISKGPGHEPKPRLELDEIPTWMIAVGVGLGVLVLFSMALLVTRLIAH